MIARAGSGWQTVLADLSLILFMATASAVSENPDSAARPAVQPAPRPSPRSEPLALYRPGPGAPPLAQWLAAQSFDPRQQLTVTVRYAPGGEVAALETATALVADGGTAASRARVVVEPGPPGAVAALAFDVPAQ